MQQQQQQQQQEDDEMLVPHTDFPEGPQPMEGNDFKSFSIDFLNPCTFLKNVVGIWRRAGKSLFSRFVPRLLGVYDS